MSEFLQLVLALAILIACSKAAGFLSTRIGQPAVLGELLAGLLLGPSLIDLLHFNFFPAEHLEETVQEVAEMGVIFLMFMAGLEIDLDEMRRAGKTATSVGTMGVVVPLLLGGGTALLFGYSASESLFVGVVLTATSVSISAQTLLELGKLRTKVGTVLLGAAVIDDVEGILLLSIVIAILTGAEGGALSILFTIARMAIFLVGSFLLGRWLFPRILDAIERWPISQPVLSFAVVVVLLYSWSAEIVGAVAAITGAFIAGVLFGRTRFQHTIDEGMRGLSYAFFIPIFFTSIGLHTDIGLLTTSTFWLAIVICIVAILSKVIGCGLGARLTGMSNVESLQIGVGMISRGEVGLIVATVGVAQGLVGDEVFAVTVLMVLVTTLVTPLLLRMAFRLSDTPKPEPESETVRSES